MKFPHLKPGREGVLERVGKVVQLAHEAGGVSVFAQIRLKQAFVFIERGVVDPVAMTVRLASAEKRLTRRHAHRGLDEAVEHIGGLRGQSVQVGCSDEVVAIGADAIEALLVCHDEQDV